MANEITLLSEAVYALRETFTAVAIDRGINFDKEAGFAMQLLSANDYIMSVAMNDRASVENAITNVAAIGISLNPAKKQAYLVPRTVNKQKRICLDISYMGLIDMAIASGSILWAQANIVRANDNFIINGFDKPPTHEHNPFAGATARGPIVGAYVVVKTADGEYLTHPMDIDNIYSIRDRSEAWKAWIAKTAKSAGPWGSDEGEMIKKTVVKQACKYWPKTEKSGRVDQAIHYLNTESGEGFEPIKNATVQVIAEYFDPQSLISKIKTCKTDAEAAKLWADNNGKLAKQPADHAAFKAAVIAHRNALKKAAETPIKTFEDVMAMLYSAKTEDALYVAGEWMEKIVGDDATILQAKFDERLAELREGK